jgi:hypothetical protein
VTAAFHYSHSADLVEFNGLKTQIDDRQGCAGHVITRPQLVLDRCQLDGEGWAHAYRADPSAIDEWKEASGIMEGPIFRSINKMGH